MFFPDHDLVSNPNEFKTSKKKKNTYISLKPPML